jgi:hypothetical protein
LKSEGPGPIRARRRRVDVTRDELLDTVSLYWFTQRAGSAERYDNLQRWTHFPQCDHYAPMEQQELQVDDIREFFRSQQ